MEKNNPKYLLEQTIIKIDGAYAPSTIRAYGSDFRNFISHCEKNNHNPLPAEPSVVADYVGLLSTRKISSSYIRRIVLGIAIVHQLNRLSDPTKDPDVRIAMRRMHRNLGRNAHQALGITKDVLEKLIGATSDSLRGARDRALLHVAYDTLSRRSEVTSLLVEDIEWIETNGTAKILLRRSKTDQEAYGRWMFLTTDATTYLKAWLNLSQIKDGKIFRGITNKNNLTNQLCRGQVNRIYKQLAKLADLKNEVVKEISSHSTRVGAAQDLMTSGASLPIIMTRGRWTKPDTVMRYLEQAALS